MTQAQAIAKGYTHFIEVWRGKGYKEGHNQITKGKIDELDYSLFDTTTTHNLYTVCIFLIKTKPKQ